MLAETGALLITRIYDITFAALAMNIGTVMSCIMS